MGLKTSDNCHGEQLKRGNRKGTLENIFLQSDNGLVFTSCAVFL